MMLLSILFAASVFVFMVGRILASRRESRPPDEVLYCTGEVPPTGKEDNLLAFGLGARIFSSEDYRLVQTETSARFGGWFDRERKALALDWLARVRTHVRKIIWEHRITAARSRSLEPAKELELAFQFLVFEATGRILYCLILIQGPANLSTVTGTFLAVTEKLRNLLERTVQTPTATLEAVKN